MTAKKSGKNSRSDEQLGRPGKAASDAIAASFTLRGADAIDPVEHTEARIRQLVSRAEQQAGAKVESLKVMPFISSFSVRGSPELVRKIREASEVETSMASDPGEDVLIRPVHRHEVTLEDGSAKAKRERSQE